MWFDSEPPSGNKSKARHRGSKRMSSLKKIEHLPKRMDNASDRTPTFRKKKLVLESLGNLIGVDEDIPQQEFLPNEPSSLEQESKWPYEAIERTYNGATTYEKLNQKVVTGKSIIKGITEFKANPDKYIAIHYWDYLIEEDWPSRDHEYMFVLREGTERMEVTYDPEGERRIHLNVLPISLEDDTMYQQEREEEWKREQEVEEEELVSPLRRLSRRISSSVRNLLTSNSDLEEELEKRREQQAEARKRGDMARLRRLELDEKRLREAIERYAIENKSGVTRIPKRSALLARGGPDSEEYRKLVKEEKLAKWQAGAGTEWLIPEHSFDGVSTSETLVEQTILFKSVEEAIEDFKSDPVQYRAMYFSAGLLNGKQKKVQVTHVLREGTTNYKPLGVRKGEGGIFALFEHIYKRLEPMKNDLIPKTFHDDFTSSVTFKGKKLHNKKRKNRKPLLPGRGMGLGDTPTMTLIGDCAEPNDIFQGYSVGNCWLLSAIACLADFDFAVRRLFRKTSLPKLEDRPVDAVNQYIVTLWDLTTWKEVDIVVDERLPVRGDGSGFLLGARPSKEGKTWVQYLEKAIAVHCGGYDKLVGGNCTNAWPLLTGSRNQYMMVKNSRTNGYKCTAKYNPYDQKWASFTNSPHDSDQAQWFVEWPKVGGGGGAGVEMSQEELFHKIVAWDRNNYLIGAGTDGSTDKDSTDGLVDNHAYSIIDCGPDICGTGIDLLLIRNPWGEGGELKSAQFARNGPGWKTYPNILSELNPSTEDNGMCWITKEEFFKSFPTVYLSAFNMARLQDPNYVNDLGDDSTQKESPGTNQIDEDEMIKANRGEIEQKTKVQKDEKEEVEVDENNTSELHVTQEVEVEGDEKEEVKVDENNTSELHVTQEVEEEAEQQEIEVEGDEKEEVEVDENKTSELQVTQEVEEEAEQQEIEVEGDEKEEVKVNKEDISELKTINDLDEETEESEIDSERDEEEEVEVDEKDTSEYTTSNDLEEEAEAPFDESNISSEFRSLQLKDLEEEESVDQASSLREESMGDFTTEESQISNMIEKLFDKQPPGKTYSSSEGDFFAQERQVENMKEQLLERKPPSKTYSSSEGDFFAQEKQVENMKEKLKERKPPSRNKSAEGDFFAQDMQVETVKKKILKGRRKKVREIRPSVTALKGNTSFPEMKKRYQNK